MGARGSSTHWAAWLAGIGLSLATVASAAEPPRFSLCFDYGCARRADFRPGPAQWAVLADLFRPPTASAAAERERIRVAIAYMEMIAGRRTPLGRDRGGNPFDAERPGRLDCIDESTNTTAFLRAFEAAGWLTWHRVVAPAYRAPLLFDQHWAAQIQERGSGRQFVVDSWVYDNGQPPLVQPLAVWRAR
ncbi:hypothetical protein [Thiohalobacter sp.]|uniref:hypothetical protein n=1 Tax=Thiohalobacter sp. TaxID=2025948 RepID=UPI002639BFE3|nr:hypothetical protein [Thiohalobacter sp.]